MTGPTATQSGATSTFSTLQQSPEAGDGWPSAATTEHAGPDRSGAPGGSVTTSTAGQPRITFETGGGHMVVLTADDLILLAVLLTLAVEVSGWSR